MSDFPEIDSIPLRNRLFYAFFIPVLFVGLMWIVKGFEWIFDTSFYRWGVFPRRQEGLAGIIFYPFLHQDFKHLFGNSIPMFFSGRFLVFLLLQHCTPGICMAVSGFRNLAMDGR